MSVTFTRNLGSRSGIQLNPLIDSTEGRFSAGDADRVIAIIGCFDRGRVDKPFRVNRATLKRMLGKPASIKLSALNEAYVQIYEALRAGAAEFIVMRLSAQDGPTNSDGIPLENGGFKNHPIIVKGGPVPGPCLRVAQGEDAAIGVDDLFSITHHEAFNDGVIVDVSAKDKAAGKRVVTLTLKDKDGGLLYEISGSLNPADVDEFGQSIYIPSVAESITDNVSIEVYPGAMIADTAAFFGEKKSVSAHLQYVEEGGRVYSLGDLDRVCDALKYSPHDFGYLISGGTRSVALLSKLISLGKDINKQVLIDIPGDLPPAAATSFLGNLNVDTHYAQVYWAPLYADDPLSGGKAYIGLAGFNAGLRCARNARTNAHGIAPKNWVIAGAAHPVERTGIVQKYTPNETELDDMAKACINPVLYTRYSTGGQFVFVDSLTCAKTDGDRKLIAVAEMSSSVDDWITSYGQQCLQLPLLEGVKRMSSYMQRLFEATEAAKWIKPSAELDGAAFVFSVQPNSARPADRIDANYGMKYDGTTRAIYAQQTLSR